MHEERGVAARSIGSFVLTDACLSVTKKCARVARAGNTPYWAFFLAADLEDLCVRQ